MKIELTEEQVSQTIREGLAALGYVCLAKPAGLVVADQPDGALGASYVLGDSRQRRPGLSQGSDFSHRLRAVFGWHPSTLRCVSHVLSRVAQLQMVRPNTGRVIALVKHKDSGQDWPVGQYKGNSVRQFQRPTPSPNRDATIPLRVPCAVPRPAPIAFRYLSPKPFLCWLHQVCSPAGNGAAHNATPLASGGRHIGRKELVANRAKEGVHQ